MFKLKKKKHSPKVWPIFPKHSPNFPPKIPQLPQRFKWPQGFGCKKKSPTSFGTSDTAENKCSPRRVQVNFDHESWSQGSRSRSVAWKGCLLCKSPPFFGSHIPKYDGYIIAKRRLYLFPNQNFLENYPLSVYRSLTKKNAASGPQMHQNVVLEPLRKTLLPLKHQ